VALPATREEQRRQEILQATWRLISHRGYHNVRIADIAREVGTATGTVHYYFPGKDDVLDNALVVSFDQAFSRQQQALLALDDARDRLIRLIDLQIPVGPPVSDEWSVWLQFWSESVLRPELRERNHEMYSQWRDTIRRITERGVRQGTFKVVDVDEFVTHFCALLDGLAIQVMGESPTVSATRMRQLITDWVRREAFVDPAYEPPSAGRSGNGQGRGARRPATTSPSSAAPASR
jgi:AcrR family transcriptional regulator